MPQQAFWRGLLEGFSQSVSVFTEASQNHIFSFSITRQQKNLKTISRWSAHIQRVGTDLICKIFQKIFISRHKVTQSLYLVGSGLKLLRHFIKGGNFPFLLGALCLFAACVSYPIWAKTVRPLPRSSLGKPDQMWAPFSYRCYEYECY
jgi:hypothetical protein